MPGTTVAGLDVGGLSKAAARDRIIHDLGDRLSAPVTVQVHGATAFVVPSSLGIKLDAERVQAVRRARGTQREIAQRFGISQTQVSKIKLGRSWRRRRTADALSPARRWRLRLKPVTSGLPEAEYIVTLDEMTEG